MLRQILKRLNGATARGLSGAGLIALTAASLAACGREATAPLRVAAQPVEPGNFEFPLVHPRDSTPDGRRTVRLDSSKGTLEIAYVDRSVVTHTATVKVGMQPVSVRVASNREAWVVDPIADSISIVDLDSATVTATLQTAPEPSDVLFSGSPSRAYVTIAHGRELLVFDPVAPAEPLTRIALQSQTQHSEADDT